MQLVLGHYDHLVVGNFNVSVSNGQSHDAKFTQILSEIAYFIYPRLFWNFFYSIVAKL